MPELPECALFAKDLEHTTWDKELIAVDFPQQISSPKWQSVITPPEVIEIARKNVNKNWRANSYGKLLQYGPLQFRLGMTGRFSLKNDPKHAFMRFVYDDGSEIYYVDFRRFGRVQVYEPVETDLSLGGYRHLEFTTKSLFSIEKHLEHFPSWEQKARIVYLWDTGAFTGVGNYLCTEALGSLRLSPFKPFTDREELAKTLWECTQIAQRSYAVGGNSFAGGYLRLDGSPGQFQAQCKVYRNPALKKGLYRGRPVYSTFKIPQSKDL